GVNRDWVVCVHLDVGLAVPHPSIPLDGHLHLDAQVCQERRRRWEQIALAGHCGVQDVEQLRISGAQQMPPSWLWRVYHALRNDDVSAETARPEWTCPPDARADSNAAPAVGQEPRPARLE